MAKIQVSKPLRRFDFQLVLPKLDGLLFNINGHLQRLERKSRNPPSTMRKLALLTVLLRFTRNSFYAVRFLAGDTPEDPNRKPNYALVVPAINRQLLDLLFSLVYMMDDFERRSLEYQQAGWRESLDEYQHFKTHFSSNPEWASHLRNLNSNLEMMVAEFGISAAQQTTPELVDYWKQPYQLKDAKTRSRAFLRYLERWMYRDTSAQAHLTFGGLRYVAAFLVADMAGGQLQQFMEERIFQQFRFWQISRTAFVTLAIATEIDVHLRLGYKDDALYLWNIFNDHVLEAKELFAERYEKLLASYS